MRSLSRFSSTVCLVGCAFAVLSCNRDKPSPASIIAEAASPSASASAINVAPPVTSAAPTVVPHERADKPLTDDEQKRVTQHKAAFARGRKATLAKDYTKAIVAFNEAALADPTDGRTLAERGFAKLLQEDLDGARNDLEAAMALTTDPVLLSPIWFNLGLAREKASDEEGARVAFANAHLLKPSAATRAKTAGKPTCTVVVRKSDLTDLTSAQGWMEIYKAAGTGEGEFAAGPKNDKEAREQVCGVDHFGQTPDCREDAPFSLMRDYLMYTYNQIWVFPRGKNLFWVYNGSWRLGGWPARCYGMSTIEASIEGGLIRVRVQNDGKGAAFDGEVNDEGRCKDAPSKTTEEYFDAKTGIALAAIDWMGTSGATIQVQGRSVIIDGAGCKEKITLGP